MLTVEIANTVGVTFYAGVRRIGYQRRPIEGSPIGVTLWFDRQPTGLLSKLIARLKPWTIRPGFIDETAICFDRGTVTIWQDGTSLRTFTIGEA